MEERMVGPLDLGRIVLVVDSGVAKRYKHCVSQYCTFVDPGVACRLGFTGQI